ncbi:hypothetical protein BX600DRAFT_512799 [Xylariales sp. PMI_506]|nr:hypothetical protein BX600DRAFT_512799 [Xylariales sp. PMI_506]
MSLYEVQVRDYTNKFIREDGSVQSRRVRSPHMDLLTPCSSFVAQPLEGNLRHKTIYIDATDVHDNIDQRPYLVEAHGATILSSSGAERIHPVWAYWKNVLVMAEPYVIDVVDLVNLETSKHLCSLVCWVPQFETDGGLLVTLLDGLPRAPTGGQKNLKVSRKAVVLQTPGAPSKTKLVYESVAEISKFRAIDGPRKQLLFETQLAALRATLRTAATRTSSPDAARIYPQLPSLVQANVERLLSSTIRFDAQFSRRPSPEDKSDSSSGWSSDDEELATPTEVLSDDSSIYDDDDVFMQARRRALPSHPQTCVCDHPDVIPSFWNPTASHWHAEDNDCPKRSEHNEHCIFTIATPRRCVRSGEHHIHCLSLTEESSLPSPASSDATLVQLSGCTVMAEGLSLESPLSKILLPPDTTSPPFSSSSPSTMQPDHNPIVYDDKEFDFLDTESLDFGFDPFLTLVGGSHDGEGDAHMYDLSPLASIPNALHSPPPPSAALSLLLDTDMVDIDEPLALDDGSILGGSPWEPVVRLDALPSTPAPQDLLF